MVDQTSSLQRSHATFVAVPGTYHAAGPPLGLLHLIAFAMAAGDLSVDLGLLSLPLSLVAMEFVFEAVDLRSRASSASRIRLID